MGAPDGNRSFGGRTTEALLCVVRPVRPVWLAEALAPAIEAGWPVTGPAQGLQADSSFHHDRALSTAKVGLAVVVAIDA